MTSPNIWTPGGKPFDNVNNSVEVQHITPTAGQQDFTLTDFTYAPYTNSIQVYLNGVLQRSGTDYLEISESSIRFLSANLTSSDTLSLIGMSEFIPTVSADLVSSQQIIVSAPTSILSITSVAYVPFRSGLQVYVNGLLMYPGRDYIETTGSRIEFTQPLDTNDEVLIRFGVNSEISGDAAGVSYIPVDGVVRTVAGKLGEFVSVKDFGAVGDGVTDDTEAIQAAVTHCFINNNRLYWPDGTYLTMLSINNFHNIHHIGSGAVQRGSDVYRVNPADTNTNIIYVAPAGASGNDGMSASQPTTIGKAVSILKSLGVEALNGTWRIQMAAGTYNDTGVTLSEMPFFKNKLEIFGEDVDETLSMTPTTVWDGAVSGSSYALRLDSSIFPSASTNLFIKNIKLQNWTSGGIVIWSDGNVLVHNVHIDTCPIGMWFRHGYFKVFYGVVNNCSTWGIGVQYNGTGNIGSLTDGTGVTLSNCGDGIQVGRFSVCYIQRCTFSGNSVNIDVEWMARARTQANVLGAPTNTSVNFNGNSLFTDDNGAGYPNTFPTLTETVPYSRSLAGSVNPAISRYGQRALHNYAGVTLESGGTPVTIFSVATTSQILLADPAYGGSDFVPFRLPAYALFSPTFELEIELGISLSVNAGGTLALHGQGSSAATKLCEIVIPTAATARKGWLKIKVINTPNSSAARYEIFFPPTGLYAEGATSSLNNAAIRSNSESTLLFRLYWTSATVDTVQFFNMRTYVIE